MAMSGIFKDELNGTAPYVLFGAPFDASSSFRPGARMAPQSIRHYASSLGSFSERGIDLGNLQALDAGDLELSNRVKTAFSQIEQKTSEILQANAIPFILGGDHSITIPSFSATHKQYPELNLLFIDAHPDLYPEYEGDPFSHACVVARILELEGMTSDRVTQAGIRTSSRAQREVLAKSKVRVVPAWEFDDFAFEAQKPLYISVDIDALDPAYAPGCGNPVPGGISMRSLLNFIHRLKAPIVAVDVVEVNPLVDRTGITELAAVRVITEILANLIENENENV